MRTTTSKTGEILGAFEVPRSDPATRSASSATNAVLAISTAGDAGEQPATLPLPVSSGAKTSRWVTSVSTRWPRLCVAAAMPAAPNCSMMRSP